MKKWSKPEYQSLELNLTKANGPGCYVLNKGLPGNDAKWVCECCGKESTNGYEDGPAADAAFKVEHQMNCPMFNYVLDQCNIS